MSKQELFMKDVESLFIEADLLRRPRVFWGQIFRIADFFVGDAHKADILKLADSWGVEVC